jgi:hypothetical protein
LAGDGGFGGGGGALIGVMALGVDVIARGSGGEACGGGGGWGGRKLGVAIVGPERDAKSSVAARFNSSARCAAPACAAASTARLSHTMAS